MSLPGLKGKFVSAIINPARVARSGLRPEDPRPAAIPRSFPANWRPGGENPAFAAAGGLINFSTETDQIRFEIHLEAAEHGGFKFSSQLLKVAKTNRRKAP